MKEHKGLSYRVWLLIFAIVFLLGLVGIFGLRTIISTSSEELRTVIQTGIIILVDAVLAVVAIILSIRATLKSSTYKVWFLIIAIGFILNFGLGLIATIDAFNIVLRYDFAHHKVDYYNVIGNSIIPLIYGALSIVAIILSRRISTKTQRSSISK